jgi:hypothetical protein
VRPDDAPRQCKACGRALDAPGDVGWECDCGVVVCTQDECVSEYFRFVAGGEATRCLACGAVL